MIFNGFGQPVGGRFLLVFLFFRGYRLSILSVSSEVCFLVGLGEQMTTGSVLGCIENIIHVVFFVWSHFFTYFVNWMISKWLFGSFLGTLGSLFLICEGLGSSDC